MHIMLVNDDGIHAPGIRVLADAAIAAGHRVSVCAPAEERSAASHSITLRGGLKPERVEFYGAEIAYAVDGTPADCARLGLFLIPGVDAVLSGVNNGENLGGACVYSGTVAAAMEASMSGVPGMAVSYGAHNKHCYEATAKVAMKVLDWMMEHPLPRGQLYNLNVPDLPYEEIRGVVPAKLTPRYLESPNYRPVMAEDGMRYAYLHGESGVPQDDPEGDEAKYKAGFATITAVSWNMMAVGSAPDVSGISL